MIQNFTDNKKTNIQIHIKTVEESLEDLTASESLQVLEKLAMKIRKANSIKINKAVEQTKRKYPKK